MNDKNLKKQIQILIEDKKPIFCGFAVTFLINHLESAMNDEDFFQINYEKYAKNIIDQSNLPPKRKEEIRKKFKTVSPIGINPNDKKEIETDDDSKSEDKKVFSTSTKSIKELSTMFDTKDDIQKENDSHKSNTKDQISSCANININNKVDFFQHNEMKNQNKDQLDSPKSPKDNPLIDKVEIFDKIQSIDKEENDLKKPVPKPLDKNKLIKYQNNQNDEEEEEEEYIKQTIQKDQKQQNSQNQNKDKKEEEKDTNEKEKPLHIIKEKSNQKEEEECIIKAIQNDQNQNNDHDLENDETKKDDEVQQTNQVQNDDNDDDDDDDNDDDNDDDDDDDDDDDEMLKPKLLENPKEIICTACKNPIDKNDIIYFDENPYHIHCIKCMKCNKTYKPSTDLNEDLNDFICITPGLFFCRQHYDEYQASKQLPSKNLEEYHSKNKENFIKEIFEPPFINDNETSINEEQSDEYFITTDIVDNLIPKDRPYEDFIPTAIFKFDKQPQDIDFDMLQELLGDELIVLSVEHGCTILKIAFLSIKKLSQKVIDTFKNLVQKFKEKLTSTIGKPVVGNLVEEKLITVPNVQNIQNAYNKPSLNLLQNTSELNSIDIETMKNEVLGTLHKEKVKKNWSFIFSHEQIFKQIEEQVRLDLKLNEFEMIIVAQTIIANKNLNEYEKIKKQIPSANLKEVFVYHGSKLANHQKIVKKHFLMPGQDVMEHQLDSGYYGKGIYATENLFYAAKYANGYCDLELNEKTHVICCMAVYNDSKVKNLNDLSWIGKKIEPNIADNYGINHAFVGSSTGFHPIQDTEEEKNKNYIYAEEFVFPNKFQIIPMCSFTLMRKDYYILWKDENITNNENANYLNELSKKIEVNVYSENNIDKALDIIRKKKKNKIKLITNGGIGLTGKQLILEARKITQSNFVCLVFASSQNHYDWIKELENVLFTTSPADFKEFAAMDLSEKPILDFAHKLEKNNGRKFNINEKELLNFPLSSKTIYK